MGVKDRKEKGDEGSNADVNEGFVSVDCDCVWGLECSTQGLCCGHPSLDLNT